MSANVRPSVSGKMLYINTQPIRAKKQLNNVTPGNDKDISRL